MKTLTAVQHFVFCRHKKLQTAEATFAGVLQIQAVRDVDDKLGNNTVLNETVWLLAIRQVV